MRRSSIFPEDTSMMDSEKNRKTNATRFLYAFLNYRDCTYEIGKSSLRTFSYGFSVKFHQVSAEILFVPTSARAVG